MCCVGTRFLISDYNYIIDRFLYLGAVNEDSAVGMDELDFDFSEHMFARDNLQSLLRCKDIAMVDKKLYLKNDRRRQQLPQGKQKLFNGVK